MKISRKSRSKPLFCGSFDKGRSIYTVTELMWQQSFLRFGICVLLAGVLWFIPISEDLPVKGWHVFSVFIAVIVSFILRPYPIGAMVIFGLVALMATGIITTQEALAGYGDPMVWLIVAAFLLAGGIIRTGLGRRLALLLVSRLAKSPLGLGYSICGAELLLGPVVPSNTARGGGILAPIVRSLAEALDSHPTRHPERAGTYLALVGVTFDWGTWALGSLVPGIVGLALLPVFIFGSLWIAGSCSQNAFNEAFKERFAPFSHVMNEFKKAQI